MNKKERKQRVKLFVEELTALTKKHGVCLKACGCCEGINIQISGETGRFSVSNPVKITERGKYVFSEVFDGMEWREPKR